MIQTHNWTSTTIGTVVDIESKMYSIESGKWRQQKLYGTILNLKLLLSLTAKNSMH